MSEGLFPEVDADVVVAEVVMLKAESDNAILIVEGGSDEKLLWDFINHDCCTIVIAEGKVNATAASATLTQEGARGVLCLVDKDFDEYLGINHANDNLIVTSLHDAEMLVINSNAFHKLLREMGSKAKLKKIADAGELPLTKILEAAYPIAVLRLISLRDELHLKFDGLNLRYLDRKTLTGNERNLCRDLISYSKSKIPLEDLCARLESSKSLSHDRAVICCGHDVTILIGKALQSLLGSKSALLVDAAEIESRLRLAFGWDDFLKTSVYQDIRAWEARNGGFEVLIQAA